MSEESFTLSGPISRRPTARSPVIEGRRYRVWVRIGAISRGSVCVWVGGNRTEFFTAAGEHSRQIVAGDRMEVVVQGLNTDARIDSVAVSEAAD